MDDIIRKIWPKWSIVELIGSGSYGKVYKVKREEFGYVSYAAVKVIQIPQHESDLRELSNTGMNEVSLKNYCEDIVKGLINEIRIMGSLKTSNHVVSIEDYEIEEFTDQIGWRIYIRMELLVSDGELQSGATAN